VHIYPPLGRLCRDWVLDMHYTASVCTRQSPRENEALILKSYIEGRWVTGTGTGHGTVNPTNVRTVATYVRA
jgi:hypothetical protein